MKIYGIDFGTSKSCIARVRDNGAAEMISMRPLSDQTSTDISDWAIPSQIIVSPGAIEDIPYNFRLLNFREGYAIHLTADVAAAVISGESRVTKLLKLNLGGDLLFEGAHKSESLHPEGLVALLLRNLLDAADPLCREKQVAVIGVPADFTNIKKKALVYAGRKAGLDDVVLLEEPLAALISLKEQLKNYRLVMVIDFGGGTCNYAIFEIGRKWDFRRLHAGAYLYGGENITDELLTELAPSSDYRNPYERWLSFLSLTAAKIRFAWQPDNNQETGADLDSQDPESSYDGLKDANSLVPIDTLIDFGDSRPPVELKLQEITYGEFAESLGQKVKAVRDAIRDDIASRAKLYLGKLDAVVFLGESRRLSGFTQLFLTDWLEKEAPQAKFLNLDGIGDTLQNSSQSVAAGCAAFGNAYYNGSLLSVRFRNFPLQLKTSSGIEIELFASDSSLLRRKDKSSRGTFHIEAGERLPITRTLYFQIQEVVSSLEVRFRSASGEEVYIVEPDKRSRFRNLPANTYVWIAYEVRVDQLIELQSCRSLASVFSLGKSLAGRLFDKDKETESPQSLAIPLTWHSKDLDYRTIDVEDRKRYRLEG